MSNAASPGDENTRDDLISVALFPLPGMVAFPGTSVPLHIFEPRYRTMINDCLQTNRELALCNARKEIQSARKNQEMTELLQSNQATYAPCKIFSAGPVEVLDRTKDGRLYIKVKLLHRLRLVQETQTLPYRIALCEPLHDVPDGSDEENCRRLQQEINQHLMHLMGEQKPQMAELLSSPVWHALTPAEFSFKLFGLLRMDGDIMQQVLESPVAEERLSLVQQLLENAR